MMKLFENNTQKQPVVTFILGNGFDRSLHMNTAYEHVYNTYVDTTYNRCVYDELMEIEDEKREKLMRRLGIADSDLENQIHIPVGYDIFDFKFKKVEENRLPQRHNIFEQ